MNSPRATAAAFTTDRSPLLSSAERSAHQRASETTGREAGKGMHLPAGSTARRRSDVLLGKTTKLPSPPVTTEEESERRKSRRGYRFRLRDQLSKLTTVSRVGACGRCRVDRASAPVIRIQGELFDRVAHYSGVRLCGSVHLCPVCSPKIRQRRADDIDTAAQRWIEANGAGSVMLLTLTMPHDYGEGLADLLRTVRASFGAMVSGKAWQMDKANFGVDFYIVAHDTTVGVNGWHPHLHVLLFGGRELNDLEVMALGDRLHARWSRAVVKRGHRPPSREHGTQLERARTRRDVTRYIAQVVAGDDDDDRRTKPVALEMARGDLKTARMAGHRTPWQVLDDLVSRRARSGDWTPADDADDDRDVALWREWEKATKGVQAIRWSRGLRKAVGLTTEKTDEEIVAEEVGGVNCFTFPEDLSWRAVSSTPGARAAVLRAAERGGPPAVKALVGAILRKWQDRRALMLIREVQGTAPPIYRE